MDRSPAPGVHTEPEGRTRTQPWAIPIRRGIVASSVLYVATLEARLRKQPHRQPPSHPLEHRPIPYSLFVVGARPPLPPPKPKLLDPRSAASGVWRAWHGAWVHRTCVSCTQSVPTWATSFLPVSKRKRNHHNMPSAFLIQSSLSCHVATCLAPSKRVEGWLVAVASMCTC